MGPLFRLPHGRRIFGAEGALEMPLEAPTPGFDDITPEAAHRPASIIFGRFNSAFIAPIPPRWVFNADQ